MSQSERPPSHSVCGKEPWLAVNLSIFFPGLGQIYSGNVIKGWIFIFSQIILYIVEFWLFNPNYGFIRQVIFLFLGIILIYPWSLFDAYQCATSKNNLDFETTRKRNKDPWRAVFLTRIMPGIGHLYIGKTLIGFILLVAPRIVDLISIVVGLNWIVLVVLHPFVIYHAYIASPVQRENSKTPIISVAILSLIFSLIFRLLESIILGNPDHHKRSLF